MYIQQKTAATILVPLISLWATCLRLWSYSQTTFATGWDSYFYLIQIKSLATEGQMHSSDLSLIYPLMYGVHALVGDYELAFKVCAAALATAFGIATYHLVSKTTNSTILALLAIAYSTFSPHLSYFAAQYPKNLLGLILFILFVAQLPTWGNNTNS